MTEGFAHWLWNREDVKKNRYELFGVTTIEEFMEECCKSTFLLCGDQVIRIVLGEAEDYAKVHGIFDKGILKEYFRLRDASIWLKKLFNLERVFCDIPKGTKTLEKVLDLIGYRYVQDVDFSGIIKRRFEFLGG